MSDIPGASPIPPPPPKPAASAPEPGAAKSGPRLRRIAIGLAAAGFVCFGVAWVGQYVTLYQGQLRIVQDLRDAGVPYTFDEVLASYPMPPDEENGVFAFRDAAAIVDAAWDALSKEEQALLRDAGDRVYDGGEIGPESNAAINAFLNDTAAAWDLLAEMRRLPTLRFPLSQREPDLLQHISLGSISRLSVLNCLTIRRAVEEGDIDRAFEALEAERHIEKGLHAVPSIIGFYMRHATIQWQTRNASLFLSADGIASEHLDRIYDATTIELTPNDHVRALDYEFLFALNIRGQRPKVESAGEELAILRAAYSQDPWAFASTRLSSNSRLNMRLIGMDLLMDIRECVSESYPEKFARVDEVVAESQSGGLSKLFAREFIPGVAAGVKTVARTDAALDALRVAIDIERYRLATGALPDTLDALVPGYRAAIPIDPFDGQPLRYLRFPEGGYAVYSIGDDFDDDGAAPRRTLGEGESDGDIVIRVRR